MITKPLYVRVAQFIQLITGYVVFCFVVYMYYIIETSAPRANITDLKMPVLAFYRVKVQKKKRQNKK